MSCSKLVCMRTIYTNQRCIYLLAKKMCSFRLQLRCVTYKHTQTVNAGKRKRNNSSQTIKMRVEMNNTHNKIQIINDKTTTRTTRTTTSTTITSHVVKNCVFQAAAHTIPQDGIISKTIKYTSCTLCYVMFLCFCCIALLFVAADSYDCPLGSQ